MGTYEFREHTADEKFVVSGSDLNDAFSTAVKAFYAVMLGDQELNDHSHTREIILSARRLESLLYDFLNELIYLYEAQDLLLPKTHHMMVSKDGEKGYRLEAVLAGEGCDTHTLRTEVKNATYSEMEIEQQEDESVTMSVVVDI